MSDAEIIEEAIRLMDSGDYRAALPLWEKLRNGAHDEKSIGVYHLNECRCLSAIGDPRRAEQSLDELRRIDQQGQFRFYIELIDIDQLHGRGEYDNWRPLVLQQPSDAYSRCPGVYLSGTTVCLSYLLPPQCYSLAVRGAECQVKRG